jgi:hypothetical protein
MPEPNFTIQKLRAGLQGIAVGALRASFGPTNTTADIDALVDLIEAVSRREFRGDLEPNRAQRFCHAWGPGLRSKSCIS